MKVGLNILALIAILAAVAMSYPTLGKVDGLQADLSDKQSTVKNLTRSLDEATENFEVTKKNLEDAQTKKVEVSAQIEVIKSNLSAKASEIGRIDSELDEQAGELASLQKLKAEIELRLGPIDFSELPGIIAKLEQDVKDGRTENENAIALIAGAEAKIESLTKDADAVRTAIIERAARIASNSREGVILAADNDWNFVYLSKSAGFSSNERLIVKRGSQYIGKLKVVGVESGGIIADIDMDSLAPGARVRPGDRVIREVGLSQ